jgi:hypothetical protein
MKTIISFVFLCITIIAVSWDYSLAENQSTSTDRKTEVSIDGERFLINGQPTYQGVVWETSDGSTYDIEGLLMNARLVQGVFDDLNPETRGQWVYPDTKDWDPDRNTREFIKAMASWKEHGLLAFTLNLQGGCPYGYCRNQPWDNSAFNPDGSLRTDYMERTRQILDHADELGMVVILGYFYFGQDMNLTDESAVIRAVENATEWVLDQEYRNVIIEINNECDILYEAHPILQCERVHELIEVARDVEVDGRSLYVSTSLAGGRVPPSNIVGVSDFILLHGNGVQDPQRMTEMIQETRAMDVYTPMPVVNNEDDQPWRVEEQGWGEEYNNFVASVKEYASWGYFDFRLQLEHSDYNLGFQSVPVNWQISSDRKRDFFNLLARITDSPGTPQVVMEWEDETGSANTELIGLQNGQEVQQVEFIVNNEIVHSASSEPFEWRMDEIPSGTYWVKARLTYINDNRTIVVESPYQRNPWWPYGGPSR